jgi:hypothetical protein
VSGREIFGDDGIVYEVVDDDYDYDDYDDLDEDDFTEEERIHAMYQAMQDVQAREAQQDEEYDANDFQNALLFDLQGIANTLGRSLTNREVNDAIGYAEATGNAPSEALDQIGIKHLDLTNDSDRTEHLAEVIQDGMDEQGVSGADILTGDAGGPNFVISPEGGDA